MVGSALRRHQVGHKNEVRGNTTSSRNWAEILDSEPTCPIYGAPPPARTTKYRSNIVFGIRTRPTSVRPKSPSNTTCTLDIASSKTKEYDGSLRRATFILGRVYKTTIANFQITISSSHLHPRTAFDVLCFCHYGYFLWDAPPHRLILFPWPIGAYLP